MHHLQHPILLVWRDTKLSAHLVGDLDWFAEESFQVGFSPDHKTHTAGLAA